MQKSSSQKSLLHGKIMSFLVVFTREKRQLQFNFSRQKCKKEFFLGHRQTEIRRRYTITNDARSKANEISTASLCCQVCMRRFDVYLSLFEIIWRENSNCCIFAGCMKS